MQKISDYTENVDVNEWHLSQCLTGSSSVKFGKNVVCGSNIFGHKMHPKFTSHSTSFPGSLILPPRASEERPWLGLVTCHFHNNFFFYQGGVLCNQQFVALSFVEFKVSGCDCHYLRRLSILSSQTEVSNNINSNIYLKVKQVWFEAI